MPGRTSSASSRAGGFGVKAKPGSASSSRTGSASASGDDRARAREVEQLQAEAWERGKQLGCLPTEEGMLEDGVADNSGNGKIAEDRQWERDDGDEENPDEYLDD